MSPQPDAAPTFAAVYRDHVQLVARWAARLGGPGIDVEDVVQQAELKLLMTKLEAQQAELKDQVVEARGGGGSRATPRRLPGIDPLRSLRHWTTWSGGKRRRRSTESSIR